MLTKPIAIAFVALATFSSVWYIDSACLSCLDSTLTVLLDVTLTALDDSLIAFDAFLTDLGKTALCIFPKTLAITFPVLYKALTVLNASLRASTPTIPTL